MNTSNKGNLSSKIAFFAGILGFLGVILGALGAHALKEGLEARNMASAWETAVKYHLVHAAALLALAAWIEARSNASQTSQPRKTKLYGWIAGCWVGGVTLFCGSLYLLALDGPHWLGPVTPLGGLLLLIGWLLVIVAA